MVSIGFAQNELPLIPMPRSVEIDKGNYVLNKQTVIQGDASMPGGGLRSSNGKEIQQKTKAIYFHSSAITDASELANPQEIQKLKAILNA